MRSFLLILFASLLASSSDFLNAGIKPIYLDGSRPIEERVEDALSRMTLEEKVALCHAQSKFSSAGVPRLGIPEVWTSDGPHGIRPEVLWDKWDQAGWGNDSCTAFPGLTCLAATWNPEMSLLYGEAIGAEARYRNKNILLAPGINIYRTPLNGRNFEYMGEDPFLVSQMVVPYVKGVQQNGVAACVKHFALNNQETNRNTVDVKVDDRALYEIYLPGFKAAVQEGGAWAIMGAYNKYRGQWCCHNEYLLNDILRKEWGFDGVVISDWGGVHDTIQAIYNGLDMEFGTGTDGLSRGTANAYDNYYLSKSFLRLLKNVKVPEETVNVKARNILRLIFRTTMDRNRPYGSFATEAHAVVARKIAEQGIVLLKNRNNVLPVDLTRFKKIAVIGENAIKKMTVGGGSSSLKAKYELSPLDGLRKRIGSSAEIFYCRGYVGDTTTIYNGVSTGENLVDPRSKEELYAEALDAAKKADVVLFFGGLNKSRGQDRESNDRKTLSLPYGQDELITELSRVNPNIAVIIISGNAVSMPWVDCIPSIVQGWYLGSETGNAIASVVTGDVNPSGKLPFSFPVKLEDNSAHAFGRSLEAETLDYSESIYVGYRWLEKHNIAPLFSFGHGLSYTTFEYGKLTADKKTMNIGDKITFSVKVKNTGSLKGSEVVQLYISDRESSLPRPVKELKGFAKVELNPREEKTVVITIDKDALSFFDPDKHEWVAEPGEFEAHVGSSSTNIHSKFKFTLK